MKALKYLLTNPSMFFKKAYNRILRLYRAYILKDEYSIDVTKWLQEGADKTLRFEYPELNENSVVFDVGGYVGDFAHKINEKYGCKVYIFEPHPVFYKTCIERFANNDNVTPLNYGLSDIDGEFPLIDSVDGSSFLNPDLINTEKGISCKLKEILNVMVELEINEIDLMKINIEVGEFQLLLHLSSSIS